MRPVTGTPRTGTPSTGTPSTGTPSPGTPSTGTLSSGPPPAAVWRAVRLPVAVGVLVILGALGIGLLNGRYDRGSLDPNAVDPPGSRALAVLLGGRGVSVHREQGLSRVLRAAGPSSTVFLPFPDREPASLLARLSTLPPSARLVLVAPSEEVLTQVSTQVTNAGYQPIVGRDPGCDDPAAVLAGDTDLGGSGYRLPPGTGRSCYGGSLVSAAARGGQRLTIAGAGDPFTNNRLAQHGNAALTIGLLGTAADLWWVLPDPLAGTTGERAPLLSVLPGWVGPVLVELTLATVLLALWRGRRLGPLVAEPLPVVVRAAETVEGRGRLYRRARARDRAAEALRGGAYARLAAALGLAPGPGGDPAPAGLVAAVSAHSGRPAGAVQALLSGAVPADDAGLVALARSLDLLIRDTLDPGAPQP